MNIRTTSLGITLSLLCLACMTAHAVDVQQHGALSVPANRIVGLWSSQAAVRPCGSSLPFSTARNTILFHAGGTALANPIAAPGAGFPNVSGIPGVHQRGQDLGTWSFDPRKGKYTIRLRFDWYVDGAYHGYSTVAREIQLSSDGQQATGPVQVTRYAADGSTVNDVCGTVVGQRL